jgi:hypothetical protein
MEFRIAKHWWISSDLSTILVSSAFKVPSSYPSSTHELELLIHGRDDRKHYGFRSFRGKEGYPQSEMPLNSKLMHLVWLHCILWESINMHKGGLACIMQLLQMCALVGSVKVWVSCTAETGKVRLARSCTAWSCFFLGPMSAMSAGIGLNFCANVWMLIECFLTWSMSGILEVPEALWSFDQMPFLFLCMPSIPYSKSSTGLRIMQSHLFNSRVNL